MIIRGHLSCHRNVVAIFEDYFPLNIEQTINSFQCRSLCGNEYRHNTDVLIDDKEDNLQAQASLFYSQQMDVYIYLALGWGWRYNIKENQVTSWNVTDAGW